MSRKIYRASLLASALALATPALAAYNPSAVVIPSGVKLGVPYAPSASISSLAMGALTDGTDQTTAVKATIDAAAANHLCAYVAPGTAFTALALTTADDNVCVQLDHVKNFPGGTPALTLQGVSGAHISMWIDGQRSQQPASQFVHSLVVLGGANNIIDLFCTETRGDCANVSDTDGTTNYGTPTNVEFDSLSCVNSAADGRNCLSIIDGQNISVGTVHCYDQGGVIGGTTMPGCVDLEPNSTSEAIDQVKFGSIDCYAPSSTSCVAINGQRNSAFSYNVTNVDFGTDQLVCGNTAAIQLCYTVVNASQVTQKVKSWTASLGTVTTGAYIGAVDGITGSIYANGFISGIEIGAEQDRELDGVRNASLDIDVVNWGKTTGSCCSGSGIFTIDVTDSRFTGIIHQQNSFLLASAGATLGNNVAGGVQSNVVYQLDMPNLLGGQVAPVRGYNVASSADFTPTNVTVQNSDLTSLSWQQAFNVGNATVAGFNLVNNSVNTLPTFTLNGVTPVTVAAPFLTAGNTLMFELKTLGGAQGAVPSYVITPGTGFSVFGTAGDTSVYGYQVH